MKQRFLTIILCLSFLAINAQITTTGVVTYRQVMNIYAIQERDETGTQAKLFIKNEKSLYIFNRDTMLKTDAVWNRYEGNMDKGFKMVSTDRYGECYLKDLKTNKLTARQFIKRKVFMVDDTIKPAKWAIKTETKAIGGYVCQKAEGKYKGRNYTAWFTTAIPLPTGPWKLCGLPGLILEAYDDKKEVAFYFESIKPLSIQDNDVVIVGKGIKITRHNSELYKKVNTKKNCEDYLPPMTEVLRWACRVIGLS